MQSCVPPCAVNDILTQISPPPIYIVRIIEPTYWSRTLPAPVVIPNGGEYNLLEALSGANKILTPIVSAGELFITADPVGEDFILMNDQGVYEKLDIRITMELDQSQTDFYRIQLRRKADDSIVSVHPFSISDPDIPESIATVNLVSYANGATDPYFTGGFYMVLVNDSGHAVDLTGALKVLITRSYGQPLIGS